MDSKTNTYKGNVWSITLLQCLSKQIAQQGRFKAFFRTGVQLKIKVWNMSKSNIYLILLLCWNVYSDEIDASKIPVEWYSWIHHTPNNLQNNQEPNKHNWQKPHQPNLTGTKKAYYPNRNNNEISKKYKTWKS